MDKFKKALKEIRDMRIADEKYEKEEEMDKWFKNLNQGMKNILLDILWQGLTYEKKVEVYLPLIE